MKPEENPLEPSFWESMGITPIVIDNSSDETIQVGLDQLMELIEAEVAKIQRQLEDQ
ncbi:hypothetical protein OGM63_16585 [Plectonema radiosum NIES-515]|uniref:Uncharacterized protein n=1 Tax=Plectonema radiosum NIES-515 TaxID=2986073 RepID=A0ABT3B1K9_9CYAN|nr:hypothetical protein [Plectonema radiosum]MCV3215110.1 hypothetical protein [Plectonema radiosum NIES-515]